MRLSEKEKKDKLHTGKSSLYTHTKRVQPNKKPPKKEEPTAKKSYSSANLTKATNSAVSSGTQTSKYPQMTMKCSPKASLAEIKECQSQKNLHSRNKPTVLSSKSKAPKSHMQPLSKSTKPPVMVVDKAKQEIKKSLANVIKTYYPKKKTCLDISMTEVTKDATQKQEKLSKGEFNFLEPIGEGGYGKVWKVEHLKTRKLYAMKEMSKAVIIMKKSVQNVLNERKILEKLRCPFIANMQLAFNDRDSLYLAMDLLSGGDLRYHIGKVQKFSEEQTKFLLACIIVAIEHIHKARIFHRDIKPQNLVFDDQGYLRLTDFGIARVEDPSCNLDASGTPGYMAPEVLCKQVHSFPVDFYAVGIIAYELMLGKRPYYGNNRIEIRDAILSKQHLIRKNEIPHHFKPEGADFVNKLILRQPNTRLGSKGGVRQLKNHLWFQNFNWSQLADRKMKSPFKGKPLLELQDSMKQDEEALMQYKLLQRAQSKVDPFSKYYFHHENNYKINQ